MLLFFFFFFSSRRRHTRWTGDWSSDVCSSDLYYADRAVLLRQALSDLAYPVFVFHFAILMFPTIAYFQSGNLTSFLLQTLRSEERRVGKECRSWWSPYH